MLLNSILLFFVLLQTGCKDPVLPPDNDNKPDQKKSEYLHASGLLIHDGTGNNIILKGIGLGGWMIQEGYMLGTNGPQHKIREFLVNLAGKSAVDKFYEDWLKYFVAEEDVAQIAAWGYNSIRLPMHYDLYFDENDQWIEVNSVGLKLTDDLLRWCEKYKLYLILDLHAAPGGQGNVVDIVDKRDGQSLWENEKYKDMTVLMWAKLAERYANEKWIGGYDLLNEPNYDFENSGNSRGCNCKKNEPLTSLYKRIIDAIREVDKNHLIILEGNCMGGNYNGMEELATYDPEKNLALSFHSYWVENTMAKLQDKINLRSKWRVPLWRGEIGENSNTWFTDMVKLMDQNFIGWANWPWKKINNLDGPVIIHPISEWNKIINYKSSSSNPKPTMQEAQTALLKLAEGIKLANCRLMHDVSYAYINSPLGQGTKPYTDHIIPGVIYLTDYDLGMLNESWYDTDYHNISGSSSNTAWNKGVEYRNDGVDIWKSSSDNSPLSNGHFVGEIKNGEWLQFTLKNAASGSYNLKLRFRSKVNGGKISVLLNGQKAKEIDVPNTNNVWTTANTGVVNFQQNTQIRVVFDEGGFDVGFMQFE